MVVGIRGESGAGKSTLAAMLCYALNNPHGDLFGFMEFMKEYEHGFVKGKWRTANFANSLKIAMATMYGIDYKLYENGKFKDTKLGIELFKVTYTFGVSGVFGEGPKFTLATFDSKEKAEDFAREIRLSKSGSTGIMIEPFFPTWRDTLNKGGEGLHQHLGPNIALQAYEHRFDSPTEHLIMGDVRKPSEIDLIKKNNGVVIWLQRNFVYEASFTEVSIFFRLSGYFYYYDQKGEAHKCTSVEDMHVMNESGIKLGIDCKPKKNIADNWLEGDTRADFVFYNPLNNPMYKDSAYTVMLLQVMEAVPAILDKLLKHD